MRSGLNSTTSAIHEIPMKPSLGSTFLLSRQSCVFCPCEETSVCHTPPCAWIDNLISMCFSFICKKTENNNHFVGFWPPQDYVVLETEAPLTCFLLGGWYGCYMWLDFCSQISLFLTLKKNHFEVRYHWAQMMAMSPPAQMYWEPRLRTVAQSLSQASSCCQHFTSLSCHFLEANFESLPCEYLKHSRAHSRTVWI